MGTGRYSLVCSSGLVLTAWQFRLRPACVAGLGLNHCAPCSGRLKTAQAPSTIVRCFDQFVWLVPVWRRVLLASDPANSQLLHVEDAGSVTMQHLVSGCSISFHSCTDLHLCCTPSSDSFPVLVWHCKCFLSLGFVLSVMVNNHKNLIRSS